MSKQRLIGSKLTINIIKSLLEECTLKKEALTKVNSNKENLSIAEVVNAIEQQMIPLSSLYDILMAVELVEVDAPAPEPTITIEDYTELPPQYKHDCTECIFMGQMGVYDLYYCPQGGRIPTVIARFGDGGGEYKSGIGSEDTDLRVAEARAKQLGLIK